MAPHAIPLLLLAGTASVFSQSYGDIPTEPLPGDRMLAEYFEAETAKIERASLADIETA